MNIKLICEQCGNTYHKFIYKSMYEKSNKQYWREKEGTAYGKCETCYKEEKRKNEKAHALKKTEELGLPALIGTESEINWANVLRIKRIDEIERSGIEETKEVMELFVKQTKAWWWISTRYLLLRELICDLRKEEIKEDIDTTEEAKAVMQESVVFPDECSYKVPVEINAAEDIISVAFEKDDKFRELVKGMGYSWDYNSVSWKRKLIKTNGSIEDRAAELGNRLLNAGFPIRILDSNIRDKAINAIYEPECKRWIYVRSEGKYKDWLSINWTDNSDIYKTVRTLPGSVWSNPSVVVKVQYYEEVEDFANLYGFKLTEAAQEAIKTARAAKLAVKPIKPKQSKKPVIKKGLKEVLESEAGILDDLKD